jgi:hypothetical protein
VDSPPDNPKAYLNLRKKLIKQCAQFTGFDNNTTFAWSDIVSKDCNAVLSETYFANNSMLDSAGVALFKAQMEMKSLKRHNENLNNENTMLKDEINALHGVKKSARLLAGNIKRKVLS